MDPTWQFAAILGALVSTSAITGAALYEEIVLDLAWPRRPDIVRPIEGGANRKRFWIPADLVAIVSLSAATWAAWPLADSRNAVFAAVVLYVINIVISLTYFVPELQKVEKFGAQADAPSSHIWVRRNRWRGVILVSSTVALGLALAWLPANG
jgi:hypothetical protein